ncbi:protein downstream neighbor of son homolog isoform X2 [Amia ocellicauda]|uniref:protein downstream neighbor of son homolog isoform X2 n=1 Tax=Amia ocellicauda TaxID=2972642 RepID=UPI00346433BE
MHETSRPVPKQGAFSAAASHKPGLRGTPAPPSAVCRESDVRALRCCRAKFVCVSAERERRYTRVTHGLHTGYTRPPRTGHSERSRPALATPAGVTDRSAPSVGLGRTMAEQAGYSPSFKRPADTLRLRRKRALSEGLGAGRRPAGLSPGAAVPGVRPFSPGPLLGSEPRPAGRKRRNPFASIENTCGSPSKRPAPAGLRGGRAPVEAAGENSVRGAGLLLTERLLQDCGRREPQKALSLAEDDCLFDEDPVLDGQAAPALHSSPQAPVDCAPPASSRCVEFPADWSLKTRLLFTSPLPFTWTEHLKAQEEAQGLTQHSRAAHASLPTHIQEPRSCAELRRAFQQSLLFWQHPSLPWIPLFPRIGADRRLAGKSSPWSQDEGLRQTLMSEWSASLTSLHSLLRARLCPYFYVCTHQFSALFRAAGLGGAPVITALLTPTTRGLREAMRSEGIEFTLPLLEEKGKCRNSGSVSSGSEGPLQTGPGDGQCGSEARDSGGEEEEEEEEQQQQQQEEEDDDDDGGFSWLMEMGVQDKIKKPDSISVKLRKEHGTVRLDHKPESVVLVQGPDTFTLLNFLINCKSLVASAGPQAGLPPTLLAPVAFRGATLQTLKARSVSVKTQGRSGLQDQFSLEVTGPVMPHALHGLTLLLRPAQRGSFCAGLYTHEPTAVLNTPLGPPAAPLQAGAERDLGGCALHPDTLRQLLEPATLGKTALRQLAMKDYGYTWRA